MPVSIDYKNLGALNTVAWVRDMPGYLGEKVTTPGNSTARFDTFENGVAAWWELLRRYRERMHVTTVRGIITTYGGPGQDYSAYLADVAHVTGMVPSTEISLDNDRQLLGLAKAMFAYEAGKAAYARTAIPDAVILRGFELGRRHAGFASASKSDTSYPDRGGRMSGLSLILEALKALWSLFQRK